VPRARRTAGALHIGPTGYFRSGSQTAVVARADAIVARAEALEGYLLGHLGGPRLIRTYKEPDQQRRDEHKQSQPDDRRHPAASRPGEPHSTTTAYRSDSTATDGMNPTKAQFLLEPLRWANRAGARPCGAAPITPEASASINACNPCPSSRRITDPPSAAPSVSSRSTRADRSWVIAIKPVGECVAVPQSLTR